MVLAAVRQNGVAFQFASPELHDDIHVVRAAVSANSLALQFASPEFQNAIVEDLSLLKVASPSIQIEKFKENPQKYGQYISNELKLNKLKMVSKSGINDGYARIGMDQSIYLPDDVTEKVKDYLGGKKGTKRKGKRLKLVSKSQTRMRRRI
jgi:hypothetical protein